MALDFPNAKDIGHGISISPYTVTTDSEEDFIAGYFIIHYHSDGEQCVGSVMFDVPETERFKNAKWTLHSRNPLHLEPSIAQRCSEPIHGYIRNGSWEPC